MRARHRGDPGDPPPAVARKTTSLVQSAVVARARRFVGTYGGFAYLAPFCGVPAVSYYTEPGTLFGPPPRPRCAMCLPAAAVPRLLEVVAGAAVTADVEAAVGPLALARASAW